MRVSPHLWVLISLIFYPFAIAIEVAHGLIGFGFAEYRPVCCWACQDVLYSVYMDCTVFTPMDMGMDMKLRSRDTMTMMGETSDDCRLATQTYMETLAYCIKDECDKRGVNQASQAKCFEYVRPVGEYNLTFEETLPSTVPTIMLPAENGWVNQTSLVNADYYVEDYASEFTYSQNEYAHSTFSLVIWFVVVGVCFFVGLHQFVRTKFPATRLLPQSLSRLLNRHFYLSPLFKARHREPLPLDLGYTPLRPLSFFIFIYVLLNVLFCCLGYHWVWPATWWTSLRSEHIGAAADRTGVLSIANFPLTIMFAGRNSLVIFLTGWKQDTLLTFHRWAARVTAIEAAMHSILYSVQWYWDGGAANYKMEIAMAEYWWGALGTVALCIILPLAMLPFRVKAYETFLILHIVLVIVALIGTWYHIKLVYWGQYGFQIWLYIAFAIWALDRLMRLVKILMANGGLTSTEATLEFLPGGDDKFVQITVFPKRRLNLVAGQHMFLYMTGLGGKFWESHPFSVADWDCVRPKFTGAVSSSSTSTSDIDDEKSLDALADKVVLQTKSEFMGNGNGIEQHKRKGVIVNALATTVSPDSAPSSSKPSIRFIIRARKGMTTAIRQKVHDDNQSSDSHIVQTRVLLEGPYGASLPFQPSILFKRGHHGPLREADTIVFIAGGIGITCALSYIRHYLGKKSDPLKRLHPGKDVSHMDTKAKKIILAWTLKQEDEGLLRHVIGTMLPDMLSREEWVGNSSAVSQGFQRNSSGGGEDEDIEAAVKCAIETKVWITSTNSNAASATIEHDLARDLTSQLPSTSQRLHTQYPKSVPRQIAVQVGHRMDVQRVVTDAVIGSKKVAVIVCGPGGLADAARGEVVRNVKNCDSIDLIDEAFCW